MKARVLLYVIANLYDDYYNAYNDETNSTVYIYNFASSMYPIIIFFLYKIFWCGDWCGYKINNTV